MNNLFENCPTILIVDRDQGDGPVPNVLENL